MLNLIRSEVLKTRSTQVWLWMILPAAALTALSTIGQTYGSIYDREHGGAAIRYYDIFTTSTGGGVALLVLGILGLTTEFRHKTITPTLLAIPGRWTLLFGKSISYVLFAFFYAVICIVVNFAIAVPWLQAKGIAVELLDHGVPAGVLKAFLALLLTALFGLGLGALVRNQAAAMVIGIFYFAIINNLLAVIPWVRHWVYPWTPGGALDSFISNGTVHDTAGDVHRLAPLAGGFAFLCWTLVLLGAGGYFTLNRDIS